jgi:hypothetical protein
MDNLLLRPAPEHRLPAERVEDYDVISTDGMITGRIFKSATAPARNAVDVDAFLRGRSGSHATRLRADT